MSSLAILILAIVASTIGLAILAAVFQSLAALADRKKHPPPGRMINIGSHSLHLFSSGAGSPAVILDSGLPGTALSWTFIQDEVAKFTRVCSYDRAGLGWSEPGPKPRTSAQVANELRTLLQNAGIPPPYVLVGHSFGAFTMRLFAAHHPSEIAGMILADGLHPAEWHPASEHQLRGLSRAVRFARRGAWMAAVGVPRVIFFLGRIGVAKFARKLGLLASGGALRAAESLFLPVSKLPSRFHAVIGSFWSHSNSYHALADQMEALPESARQVSSATSFGDLPLIALVASNSRPPRSMSTEEVARLSSQGKLIVASGSGHWIQIDQPSLVIDAILHIITQVRYASID